MDTTNTKTGNQSQKRSWLFPVGVIAIAISSIVVVSCFHDDDPAFVASDTTIPLPDEPVLTVAGSKLYCDRDTVTPSDTASGLYVETPNSIAKQNVSHDPTNTGIDGNPASWNNHNSGNNVKRMSAIVPGQTPLGEIAVDDPDGTPGTGDEVPIGDVHPLVVSYGEQVKGDYEGGDGSADIGDPTHVDDIFVSLSLDNAKTWKKVKVGDTAKDSRIFVNWNNETVAYPGHSHKPTMAIEGNNILVAWNDKFCPRRDPFDLFDDEGNLRDTDQPDTYKVNGSQGVVDYGGIEAPNGKLVYEVPYSCVWTARGVLVEDPDPVDGAETTMYTVQWRQAQQMTSGTRDSNKIWIASAKDVGFAIAWQEDPDGLRPGKGLGPGEGWSGATTNHGADIWYTYIKHGDFDDVCTELGQDDPDCTTTLTDPTATDILAIGGKPVPAANFTYPVRITNNEVCSATDADPNNTDTTKLWCVDNCDGDEPVTVTSQSGTDSQRCVQNDIDYMVADSTVALELAVLDGDTGASRPALKLLRTDAPLDADGEPEVIAILVYEETKGLSESAVQDTDVDIALEGKAVYFESFHWEDPVTVSAGRPVNMFVPEKVVAVDQFTGAVTTESLEVYENARRVVIMPQVDPCEQGDGDPTFALLYKQGYDIQGGPSDMFVRVNYGFTYDPVDKGGVLVGGFGQLDGRDVTNVSSHGNTNDPYDPLAGTGAVLWSTTNLEDQSYTYALDNTFSPRGWLRGGEVYTGFEYSPLWRATSVGTVPNNFWMNGYIDSGGTGVSAWTGTKQLSMVTGAQVSTLDPRFIPTPAGEDTTDTTSAIASDASDPKVIFLGYGTFDMDSGHELDLLYMRSTDKGVNWEYLDDAGNIVLVDSNPATSDGIPGTADVVGDTAKSAAKLADFDAVLEVHEMELQGLASPDGTLFFGVWNEESFPGPVDEGSSHNYGLESRAGLVEYDDPDPTAPAP